MNENPLFSIVIVNYNGFKFTRECVNSILKNNYNQYEIIVVDNCSSDGSPEKLKTFFGEKLKVVCLDKNYGPSKARNEGSAVSKGQYLGFLDNDTEVDPDWIVEAKKKFDNDPDIGILQCKLMLYKDRTCLDYIGEYIGPNGFIVHVAQTGEKDLEQYDDVKEILAAKSAGMFMRREAFDAIGGFDPDYFIMVEETDLGWRNWLAGYKAMVSPKSLVFHHFSTSWSILGKERAHFNVRFHGTKNYISTLLKNLGVLSLFTYFIKHLIIWFCFAFFRLLTGNVKEFFWIMKAFWWNLTNLRSTLKKRKRIQSYRVINDRDLFAIVLRNERFLSKVVQYFKSFRFFKQFDVDL